MNPASPHDHELVAFDNGTFSVRPVGGPEAMHSHIGPWEEAQAIHIEPSGLAARLREEGPPLTVLDLGLGIAANAVAAIECFLHGEPRRELRLVSFENRVDGLRLALENQERFDWLSRHASTIEGLLAHGRCELISAGGTRLTWELREGDFAESAQRIGEGTADVVFFDFYSPKIDPGLWGLRTFQKLRRLCAPGAVLTTYAASTAARSAMLLAGFFVGTGRPTSAKTETTIASLELARLERPLGAEWLQKLARSQKPLPLDVATEGIMQIHEHPQFAKTGLTILG